MTASVSATMGDALNQQLSEKDRDMKKHFEQTSGRAKPSTKDEREEIPRREVKAPMEAAPVEKPP